MDFVRMPAARSTSSTCMPARCWCWKSATTPHFEAAFPDLDVVWLETSAGEDHVLLLTREALLP